MLDYYALPGGLLVEEFVSAEDHTTVAIVSAAWSPVDGWIGGAHVSEAVRRVRTEIRALTRGAAIEICASLPTENVLRTFTSRYELPIAAPLRFGTGCIGSCARRQIAPKAVFNI